VADQGGAGADEGRRVTCLSIGYYVLADSWNEKDRVRTLTELDLQEVSVVTFPANDEARRNLADRSEALDRQLAAGLGVVAELRADLGRRDAEVSALCDPANADAALLGEPGRACVGAALKPGAMQGLRLPDESRLPTRPHRHGRSGQGVHFGRVVQI